MIKRAKYHIILHGLQLPFPDLHTLVCLGSSSSSSVGLLTASSRANLCLVPSFFPINFFRAVIIISSTLNFWFSYLPYIIFPELLISICSKETWHGGRGGTRDIQYIRAEIEKMGRRRGRGLPLWGHTSP
jgi:hypothetical protein